MVGESLKAVLSAAAAAIGLGRPTVAAPTVASSCLDWETVPLPAIGGGEIDPATLRGKAVLVVNTASKCGFTGQYAGLEALWREYRERGLVVLGVPSNDFGRQDPGTEAEIAGFCELNYGVDFPMLTKQTVVGAAAHPLYRWAALRSGPLGVPRWNFHKLLIGRDGGLEDWFSSVTGPDSDRLRLAIDRALSRPSP